MLTTACDIAWTMSWMPGSASVDDLEGLKDADTLDSWEKDMTIQVRVSDVSNVSFDLDWP